jgi:hypothetical protein
MSFVTDLRSSLVADAGVSAIVSNRVYPVKYPLETTYPAIHYFVVSDVPVFSTDGTEDGFRARVQFSLRAKTYFEGTGSLDALRTAVRTWARGRTDITLNWASEIYEIEAKVYHLPVDVILDH